MERAFRDEHLGRGVIHVFSTWQWNGGCRISDYLDLSFVYTFFKFAVPAGGVEFAYPYRGAFGSGRGCLDMRPVISNAIRSCRLRVGGACIERTGKM